MVSKNNNNLILITNHFPFGDGEAFLESEIGYLTERFDKVIILARDVTSTGIREGKGNFSYHRVNPQSNFTEKLITASLYIKHFGKVIRYITDEIRHLRSIQKSFSLEIGKVMIHDLTKALTTSIHINRLIHEYDLKGTVTLYSYWLTSSALATTFINAKEIQIKRISRAHGGDVYEFRSKLQYLSFRKVLAMNLDRIFTVSVSAASHIKNVVGKNESVRVSRLGTQPPGSLPQRSGSTTFTIVSCSYLLSVKRVHLIIDALSLIEEVEIFWIHIGDGVLRNELENLAKQKLSHRANIRYQLSGSLSNENLIRFYTENFVDLFINTSSSEGVPVTMMEAQSFGIPIVGPEVGGVPEIVSDQNGRLFPADFDAKQIAALITDILTLPPEERANLRLNARRNWEERYNAERNFPTFVGEILTL